MYEDLGALVVKVRSGRINCKYGSCSSCPYGHHDDFCHEYLLADCVRLLFTDLDRSHPIFDLIRDLLDLY